MAEFKDWIESDEGLVVLEAGQTPDCPECGAPMVLRTARQGRNAGNQFYGCSNYPSCKKTMGYNPNHPGGGQAQAPQQQRPAQQARQPQQAQQPGVRNWIYAKVTKKGDKRFPKLGTELALSKGGNGMWDYKVLSSPNDMGILSHDEVTSGLIESLRNIKTNKPLMSQKPSLEDLEQQFNAMGGEQPAEEQGQQAQQGEDKRLIPPNLISQEQGQIDERFGQIVQGDQQQHIMINALAGTGKTTMLKHLAWKYGQPGQKWLYIVFNTKNKVEAQEEFPPFVQVRTSNGFLGEVLNMKQNVTRIGQTDRMASLSGRRGNDGGGGGGRLDKSRIVADSAEFKQLMAGLGVPSKESASKVDAGQKMQKSLASLCNGIGYNFKEAVLTLVGLGKSFALDPRNQQGLQEGLNKILGSYDIDTELLDIKERIAKYSPSWRDDIEYYLEQILGYDFMGKDYKEEVLKSTVWMMTQLMPNATGLQFNYGGRPVNLAQMRDFDDDLWYTATHAKDIVWPRYDVVLADEVQDFNENQKIMLNQLHEAGAKIVAVGDPNQAIYRFRGADGEAFNNLGGMLGGLSAGNDQVTYNLSNNFRSRPEILQFANEETHVKDLKAGREFNDGKQGQVSKFEHNFDDTFGDLGNEFKQSGGKMPVETAFIARTNAPLVKTALKLLAQGIPFLIVGKDIAKELVGHVTKISRMKGLRDNDSARTLAAEMSAFLDDEKDSHHGKSTKKAYLQETEETTEAILAAIDSFDNDGGGDIKAFKTWLSARLGGLSVEDNEADLRRYRQMMEEQNPVVLTTAHRSKGLEFKRVYVLRYDQFPHPKAEREEDLQQEENMRYVTLTRAQDELHILDLEGQPGYKGNDESGGREPNW